MRYVLVVAILVSGASWVSCTPPPPRVCAPGSSQTCSALGCVGVQRCNVMGTAWEMCTCVGATGAGGPGPGVGGGSVGGGSAVGGGSSGGSAGGSAGGGAAGGSAVGGGGAGGGSPGCSAATCSGCCNGTQCVLPPNNANNGTCGVNGAACVNCAANGTLCNPIGFTCTSAAGGGAAGGGGAGGGFAGGVGGGGTTCDGCVLANGTCQPRGTNRQSNTICGSFGQLCMACPGGTVCDFGACVTPGRRVGDPCVTNAECQATLGPTGVCLQSNLNGTVTFTGGMCSVENCVSAQGTDVCPMGSVCLNFPRIYGFERSACFPAGCTSTSCRAGFSCQTSPSVSFCLPNDVSNPSLVLDTTSVIGQPCTINSNCRAPTPGAPFAGGLCLSEFLRFADGGLFTPDGGLQPTGYVGGSCTRDCRVDEDCTSTGQEDFLEGICLNAGSQRSICFRGCGAPNQGQSSCRFGYVCEPLFFRDGGLVPTGICEPRCNNPGAGCTAPRTCNTVTGYCQ